MIEWTGERETDDHGHKEKDKTQCNNFKLLLEKSTAQKFTAKKLCALKETNFANLTQL